MGVCGCYSFSFSSPRAERPGGCCRPLPLGAGAPGALPRRRRSRRGWSATGWGCRSAPAREGLAPLARGQTGAVSGFPLVRLVQTERAAFLCGGGTALPGILQPLLRGRAGAVPAGALQPGGPALPSTPPSFCPKAPVELVTICSWMGKLLTFSASNREVRFFPPPLPHPPRNRGVYLLFFPHGKHLISCLP